MATNLDGLPWKSDRVLRLTATCIQAAVRLRLGMRIPFDDAIELARVHNVRSAVESIGAKLRVHESVPEHVRVQVAVSEAKLSDVVTGSESTEHIIKVRTVAFGPGLAAQMPALSESFKRGAEAIRREAMEWSVDYGGFSEDLFAMYRDAARQLKQIPITAERRAQAIAELETIIADALKRA
jgi:hypothetical protein